MPSVIGVDSSTQSCKVLVVDLDSGVIVSEATAPHPEGTEIHPEEWWTALCDALDRVDTSTVSAVSIGGQQHGLVALDEQGEVVRPALLWNDTRSAPQASTSLLTSARRAWRCGRDQFLSHPLRQQSSRGSSTMNPR